MSLVSLIASLGLAVSSAAAVPTGFPVSGNGLWYTEPAVNWSTQYLPIGNGYLGAMINGNPTSDRIQLNIESLWSGGPFADPNYNGGNHPASEAGYLATELARIRKTIFSSSNGTIADVRPLPYDGGAYGSYSGAGYLNVNRTASGKVTNYARWLDMDTAVLKTTWTEPVGSFNRSYFCSNPSRACTVHTASSTPGSLSATFSFSSLEGLPAREITCLDSTTIQLRGRAASPGMLYEILAKIQQSGPANSTAGCAVDAASGDAVLFTKESTQAWVNWVGGTEYSMETGNAASGYSFKGVDPHAGLVSLLAKAAKQTIGAALTAHIADYRSALGGFSLDLGKKFDTTKTTADFWSTYKIDVGNPYIEWLMFNYGRYMLVGSTRSYLPANLQGKWARDAGAPWSGDYHANINVQMNYWFAEMTNMKVTSSLWDYMAKTWAPRGAETARTLYNVTRGWVVHNEMNTFGHTGMKAFEPYNSAEWANYPEAASWMMVHVYDHLDYTNDIAWWRAQGWPLLKGVASFWLDHLVEDLHFKDGTLVTAPCNSPEQAVITLGCAHSQQLVWQLFEAVEKGYSVSGDNDKAFLQGKSVQSKKLKLDKGIKIGSFGQLQEWKVEFDRPNDLHRHLSHLIGLYPGYVLTNFKSPTGNNQGLPQLTREQVLKAAEVSLISRGDGTGPDGDAGWEKVWRAACWAQLQNSTQFYHVLTYAFERNFASNLWSLYNPFAEDPIFQIDANLGYPAAVLNALIQAPDTSSLSDALRVTLLPALPAAWGTGSIKGARIRGGITLDLSWAGGKAVRASLRVDPIVRYNRRVQLWYGKRLVTAFSATAGLKRDLTKLPIRAIHHPIEACMAELAENLAAATAALELALRSYVDACSAVHTFCKNNPPGQIPDTLVNHLIQGCTVSESHEKQFRIARAMFNQARNYSLPNFAINSLPSEILVRIFHLVVGPRPCGVRDYSGEKIRFPKYPEYLSHVCSGWRDLVLKTPTLWTHIDHVPYHSLSPAFDERAYEVAKRSEYLPLHLHIYEPAFLHGYDYGNLVEFLTETSFAIQSFELVLSKNSGEFTTEYVEILESYFLNCSPKLFDELTITNPAETAPTLLYPTADVDDLGLDDLDDRLWMSVGDDFEEKLPLKILRLDGVYFPWIHPIYHSLVELRLTSSRRPGATITKLELNAILKSNPVLQVLHFGLKVIEDMESMVEPVALLPELRVLNLTSTEQDELGTFTSTLAPSPRSLQFSIELKSRSLPPYDDDVLRFLLDSNITKLRVVARDRRSYERDTALVDKLLHPVPHVRELVLDGFHLPRVFGSTQGPGERSAERDGPRLDVLYLLNGSIGIDTLQELVTRHTVKRIIFWRCSVWGAADIAHKNISVTEIRSALSEVCGDVCVTEGDQSPVEHWDW